ncbi:hypothetical protein CDD83_2020 [Cordyceps sp. RAO-2017]|nr:hypothetical protein CDD83_2020 [Cordyceps sp. RAO-2017]
MSSKRSLPSEQGLESDPKRPRVSTSPAEPPSTGSTIRDDGDDDDVSDEALAVESSAPTHRHHARCGVQRSIALVLRHVGFAAATPEAMESFTNLFESYLESIIDETKRFALAARREHPIPTDFEHMLHYHNLSTSALRPHLRNPVAGDELSPTYRDVVAVDADALRTLPLLSAELSGQADKEAKPFIPASFPDFPSRHTYRYTPQAESGSRDPKGIREEAARTAQEGEEALRKLVRASKMRKQKEVKTLVERNSQGKERFRLWETMMRRFMDAGDSAGADVADNSMIVNGDAVFSRKEVSRLGKRPPALPVNGK